MENDSFLRQPPPRFEEATRSTSGRDENQAAQPSSTTSLKRSTYILWIVGAYAVLSVVSWTIITLLTIRPLTGTQYGYLSTAYLFWKNDFHKPDYAANEKWYQAMRVIQSIVAVLTLPVTSAVCSQAAVTFSQFAAKRRGLTMRQLLVLADRGWTDPKTYWALLTPSGFKRCGSFFLGLAIVLSILGGIIQPIQQVFLTTTSIKVPIYRVKLQNIADITDFLKYAPASSNRPDDGSVVLMTRSALATTTGTEPMTQLWQSGVVCDAADLASNSSSSIAAGQWVPPPSACGYGATLGNISSLSDSFFSQLPSTTTTGVIKQFAPRFNSSSTYEVISSTDYPANCSEVGAYSVRYSNNASDTVNPWAVEACLPGIVTQTPWTSTHLRQDFMEVLYLNVSRADAGATLQSNGSLYRITMKTTAGYFELPNYMNGGHPGALLVDDPNNQCDYSCERQGINLFEGDNNEIFDPHIPNADLYKRAADDALDTNRAAVIRTTNKGPLLTIAMALFGEGSFIDERTSYPETFIESNDSSLPDGTCVDYAPLQFLQQVTYGYSDWTQGHRCIVNNATKSQVDLDDGISLWLRTFQVIDVPTMGNAFDAAAFLATKAWLENQIPNSGRTLSVSIDLGVDTQVPAISVAGIVFISTLLAIFLLSLLAMAIFSSMHVRWTSQLDAFAMMRVGAAVGSHVPFMVGRKQNQIAVLDRLPGWIGDEQVDHDRGSLGIGARAALQKDRKYYCYEGDHEKSLSRGDWVKDEDGVMFLPMDELPHK
ncbi:hypothetical protein LTR86_007961 [Recurvomyces mirabilis]|nr:hypothetical protein LTR86_007961 [Recurvomyces mirabilis]